MTEFEILEVPTVTVAGIRRVVAMNDLPSLFDTAYPVVGEQVASAGGRLEMPPFGWYHSMTDGSVDVTAGFIVSGDVHTPDGGVQVTERPGGRAVVGQHVGPYDTLGSTWNELTAWASGQSLAGRGDMWEEYLTPPEGDPADWVTRLVYPLA